MNSGKAKKKPVVINYFDVRIETSETVDKLQKWVESFGDEFESVFELDTQGHYLKVKTLEGTSYEVSAADVIIRGVKGEYYPCKRDIFEQTYDIIVPDLNVVFGKLLEDIIKESGKVATKIYANSRIIGDLGDSYFFSSSTFSKEDPQLAGYYRGIPVYIDTSLKWSDARVWAVNDIAEVSATVDYNSPA